VNKKRPVDWNRREWWRTSTDWIIR